MQPRRENQLRRRQQYTEKGDNPSDELSSPTTASPQANKIMNRKVSGHTSTENRTIEK
jgi:hypothetical protein